jgi:hypothetical protein
MYYGTHSMGERRLVTIGKRAKGDKSFEVLSEGTLEGILGKSKRITLVTETGKICRVSYTGNLKYHQGGRK